MHQSFLSPPPPSGCHNFNTGTPLGKEDPPLKHRKSPGLREVSLLKLAAYTDKPGKGLFFFLVPTTGLRIKSEFGGGNLLLVRATCEHEEKHILSTLKSPHSHQKENLCHI